MQLEHVVEVDASRERAYAVLSDVRTWPAFMSALERVRARTLEDGTIVVEMTEAAGRHRDCAWYRVRFDAPSGMRAVQERGALRHGEVTWRFDAEAGFTRVVVVHRFRIGWPLIGPLLDRAWIGPRIIHPIVARSLANFKVLVETGRSPKPGHGSFRLDAGGDVLVAASTAQEEP